MIRISPLLAIALISVVSALNAEDVTPASIDHELPDILSQWIAPLDAAGQLSGTLLVARGDTIVFERSFGNADYELGVPNRPSTRFNIASVTKPLTQIVLLSLLEEGTLEDGPVSGWIPDFPGSDQITVSHLARHRAGIPHRVTTIADEVEPQTAASMTRLAAQADLLFEPGAEHSYSSAGYSVLARVLELASGMSYGTLLRKYVSRPAGAVHTVHPDGRTMIPERARGYFFGTAPLASPPRDLSFLVGAGSVFSTPRDLFAIQRRIVAGGYGESVQQQLVGENGLRWNGHTNGYRTFADCHAEDDVTVIFAGNMFTGAADLVRSEVPKLARGDELPLPVAPRVEPFPMSDADRTRVSGSYRLGSSDQILTFDSPTLATLGDWILVPTSESTFFSPQDYAEVTIVTGVDGVEALQWGKGPRFPRSGGDISE